VALFERVKEVVVRELTVPESQVTEDATFDGDLKADSLDRASLVMALEDEFGLEIPEEDAQQITTVGAAIRYIEEQGVTG